MTGALNAIVALVLTLGAGYGIALLLILGGAVTC